MKTCKRCNKEKELTEFYKDERHKDGLASYCKSCHNIQVLHTKQKKPEKYRTYQREYIASYQRVNPNWLKASNLMRDAIKQGKLIRLPCEVCGVIKTHGHHPFYRYSEPLNVKWLCSLHHKEAHAIEKMQLDKNIKAKTDIEYANQKLGRIEKSIEFYLNYHHISEPSKTMIKGNLLTMLKNEFNII